MQMKPSLDDIDVLRGVVQRQTTEFDQLCASPESGCAFQGALRRLTFATDTLRQACSLDAGIASGGCRARAGQAKRRAGTRKDG